MSESKPINALIVEDHPDVATSVQEILEETIPMIDGVVIAKNADEARIYAHEKEKISLVIMDIKLKGSDIDGISLAAELKGELPDLNVLIYSGEANEELVRRTMNTNLSGYVTKNLGLVGLKEAVEIVMKGGIYIDPSLPKPPDEIEKLTLREEQVLVVIAKGKTEDKEISQELKMSPYTSKTHRSNIMNKRGLRKAVELYQYAIKCYPVNN